MCPNTRLLYSLGQGETLPKWFHFITISFKMTLSLYNIGKSIVNRHLHLTHFVTEKITQGKTRNEIKK